MQRVCGKAEPQVTRFEPVEIAREFVVNRKYYFDQIIFTGFLLYKLQIEQWA